MRRLLNPWAVALLSLAAVAALLPTSAQAQAVCAPPVTFAPPPSVTFAPPPAGSYYAPAPAVSYYAPPAVTYSFYPSTAFLAPAGAVTTRSYYGFGIFRPRGWYTETYVSPFVR